MKANNFNTTAIETAISAAIKKSNDEFKALAAKHEEEVKYLESKATELSVMSKMLNDALETIADITIDVKLNNETISNYTKAKELLGDAWSKANDNAMNKALERKKELENEKASYEAQRDKFIESLQALQKEFMPSNNAVIVSFDEDNDEYYPNTLIVETKLYNEGTNSEYIGFKRVQIGTDFISIRQDRGAFLNLKPNTKYEASVHYSNDGWMAFVDSVEEIK